MSKTKFGKKSDKPLLGQILDLIPDSVLSKAIRAHMSDKHCHKYKTYDQLVSRGESEKIYGGSLNFFLPCISSARKDFSLAYN